MGLEGRQAMSADKPRTWIPDAACETEDWQLIRQVLSSPADRAGGHRQAP